MAELASIRHSRKRYSDKFDKYYTDKGEQMNKIYNLGPVVHDKAQCIEFARQYKKDFLTDRKYDNIRRAFYLGMFKLVCEHSYASRYELWFGRLTPLIVSTMGYSGLAFYRSLCTCVCADNIGDDVTIPFERCIQYMYERSLTHDENGNPLPVVLPRTIYRLSKEPPFVMTEDDIAMSQHILNVYTKKRYNFVPTFVDYVLYSAMTGKCTLLPDPNSDKYDTSVCNKELGIHQTENIINMVLPMQELLFKNIIRNMFQSSGTVDIFFKLHDSLGNIINQQRHIKIDANVADMVAYQRDMSSDYLVYSNGKTYDCRLGKFVDWHESQLCMHHAELDPELGLGETIEHYSIEVHPLRGGRDYLRKMLRDFVMYVHDLLNSEYFARFTEYDMFAELHKEQSRLSRMPQNHPMRSAQEEYVGSLEKKSEQQVFIGMCRMHPTDLVIEALKKPPHSPEYMEVFNDGCTYHEVMSFLNANPDVYEDVMNRLKFGGDEDDDGGPVVFVKRSVTYEEKVWAIFDDLFGCRKNSMIVMKFLALAMRNGNNGRHILYLHGEAANGKSLFMNIVSASLDATFRDINTDVRYLLVSEMPVLDIGNRGVRLLKRFTGNDVVTMRAPYTMKNREFRNKAKIIATSNEIPYFKDSETAEITRFLIMPMRSFFMTSKSALRTVLLGKEINTRAQSMLFNIPDPVYPKIYMNYVEQCNNRANVMFANNELNALRTLLTEDVSIFVDHKETLVRHVPVCRYMHGDKNLLNMSVIEKLSAGLVRIITNYIIPSMNGITDDTVVHCMREFDKHIMSTHRALKTYKSVMVALLVAKIVKVRHPRMFVEVEKLRESLRNDVSTVLRTCTADMYGSFYTNTKAIAPESNVAYYLETQAQFVKTLTLLGFNVSAYRGMSNRAEQGTKVLYGYVTREEYNSFVNKGFEDKILFDAIVDDSHIKQYESVYKDVQDQDKFTRQHFMKPLVGDSSSDYGTHYVRPKVSEINSSIQKLRSAEN
ncbi:hypothetical protein HPB52_020999 [Rhipicephalus sanguineus]|uniref:Virulence-associated protein E-like domain-containing protein n=1 Tax=Rhipicephalus sanguineus TaxID=34632 RepID=A0A9D4Q7B9_RHISA|nr:hypothetical protein HPB52_020999 [Rhipicephalus sanguineus]